MKAMSLSKNKTHSSLHRPSSLLVRRDDRERWRKETLRGKRFFVARRLRTKTGSATQAKNHLPSPARIVPFGTTFCTQAGRNVRLVPPGVNPLFRFFPIFFILCENKGVFAYFSVKKVFGRGCPGRFFALPGRFSARKAANGAGTPGKAYFFLFSLHFPHFRVRRNPPEGIRRPFRAENGRERRFSGGRKERAGKTKARKPRETPQFSADFRHCFSKKKQPPGWSGRPRRKQIPEGKINRARNRRGCRPRLPRGRKNA